MFEAADARRIESAQQPGLNSDETFQGSAPDKEIISSKKLDTTDQASSAQP